jgi:hypothetical protein
MMIVFYCLRGAGAGLLEKFPDEDNFFLKKYIEL